jgi:hypothetical protein
VSHVNDLSTDVDQQTTANADFNKDLIQPATTSSVDTNEKLSAVSDHIKKRKSSGLFSCFGSKKSKASTEQQGPPIVATRPSIIANETCLSQAIDSVEEHPKTDFALLPDGKRIYIDVFRDRPGLNMSYQPTDFDNRFALPAVRNQHIILCISSCCLHDLSRPCPLIPIALCTTYVYIYLFLLQISS